MTAKVLDVFKHKSAGPFLAQDPTNVKKECSLSFVFKTSSIEIGSVERVALTYVAVRAENKQDGMVFVPAWQILFKEAGQSEEYTSWAEFNAINGTLINAIFR